MLSKEDRDFLLKYLEYGDGEQDDAAGRLLADEVIRIATIEDARSRLAARTIGQQTASETEGP